uniref:ELYS-bb domain-containing protein n=1 Tax=Parastrongyloides trichosuri TaxID=131310 RepID=A0A0N4ZU69_PARTI
MSLNFKKPACLKQELTEISEDRSSLSAAFGLCEFKSGSLRTGKYLYDCDGKSKYFVVAVEEYLMLYNNSPLYDEPRKKVEYSFGKNARIHDCAIMNLENNREALVVGATTFDENGVVRFGLYLLSAGREAIILDAMLFGRDCKKVLVIYDELKRDELRTIDSAFHNHPHLIMVGMGEGAGYLTYFKNTLEKNALRDGAPGRPYSAFNILRGFRDAENKHFNFTTMETSLKVKLSETEVTSLAYVESCRCLLIGFNFGGILSINLVTQRKNKIRISTGEIKAMQVQEPDDDPRPTSYVWVASINKGRLKFNLLSMMFYTDPEDPSKVDRNQMALNKRIEFEADNFTHFLGLKAVTRERLIKAENTTRHEDVNKKDTTLMLFTWINISTEGVSLEGALFDLNMFYYKRMVGYIREDGTLARQCPLFSRFSMDSPKDINFAALLDVHLNPESIYRGKSDLIINVDQFFYPSTYGFELYTFTKSISTVLSCKPIHFQYFERLYPLKSHLSDPGFTFNCLSALGFISKKDALQVTENTDKCSFILSTLLHNYSVNLIIQMVKDITVSLKYLINLTEWLYTEIQKCADHFQKIASKLFEDNSEELYSAQMTKVHHYIGVFEAIGEIIKVMKERNLSEEIYNQLYVKEVVVDTFLLYSRLMNAFVEANLFPITPEVIELHKELGDIYRERVSLARKKFYKLEIEKLIDLFTKTDLEGTEDLYPPRNPAFLINVIVAPEIKIPAKLKLISYYALDIGLLRNNESFIDKIQYNVAFYAMEKYPIDFYEIKKAWRNDAIELDSYKENVYLFKEKNSSSDYKKKLTPKTIEDLCVKVFIPREELEEIRDYILRQQYGLFIWNYIAIKREEFAMLELLNINIPTNATNEWKKFCKGAKELYDINKDRTILWRYKLPSLVKRKKALTSNTSTCNKDNSVTSSCEELCFEEKTSQSLNESTNIEQILDKDYVKRQSVAQRYENLLKTPVSASRWTRISKFKKQFKSPENVQVKEIHPTSIMKSQERVSRLRPGMKIGSRIRFNLPENTSMIDTTATESVCSADDDSSMNVSFNGTVHIEKSDAQTELEDVKCAYKVIIQDKIEEQMSQTVRHEDGKTTTMEVQTDEEMLMSDLENSPAKSGVDLITHMEERSKAYGIELPAVKLVQTPEPTPNVFPVGDDTPISRKLPSVASKKTFNFKESDKNVETKKNDKCSPLKRASPIEDEHPTEKVSSKKSKLKTPERQISREESPPSTLRRSARLRSRRAQSCPHMY